MDQFSAHLDRGWDLVQRGDPRGAELSARRALEIDAQSPEAYNLLGYVAALKGEHCCAAHVPLGAIRPSIGLDACAYSLRGIRPARKDSRSLWLRYYVSR